MINPMEMINGELVEMSDADYAAFQAIQSAAAAAQVVASLVSSAMASLTESDETMKRIQEAVSLDLTTWTTADVVAWINYRRVLRQIISTKSGNLPTKPPYPIGT